MDVPIAGMVLGVGRSTTYELVRSGRRPTRVVRLGRRIVIPTALLLDLIGMDVADADETTRDIGWQFHGIIRDAAARRSPAGH